MANADSFYESSPHWLFLGKDNKAFCYPYWEINPICYLDNNLRQPIPWSQWYLKRFEKFIQLLARQGFSMKAIQITAGGVFGEQVIPNWQDTGNFMGNYDTYYFQLIDAEKRHVDIFTSNFPDRPLILMVNSLYENDPQINDLLITHSLTKGVSWFQTNSSVARLQNCDYGSNNMNMLARTYSQNSPYVHLFLEEESGAEESPEDAYCPYLPKQNIASRLKTLIELESQYGVIFHAVTIDVTDLSDPDLDSLIKHVCSHTACPNL